MTNSVQMIHIAAKKAGLDDDTRRAKLTNIVGIASTKLMTEDQRQKVLQVFINEGFSPTAGNRQGRTKASTLSGRFASPVRAFWLSGYNLGVFREKDDRAILEFARRQTGLAHVQFAITAEHGKSIIEAIKAIVRRDSKHPDLWRPVEGYSRGHYIHDARVQVLFAQWIVLERMDAAPSEKLEDWPSMPGLSAALRTLDGPVLVEAQKAIGRLIRNAQAKAKNKAAA